LVNERLLIDQLMTAIYRHVYDKSAAECDRYIAIHRHIQVHNLVRRSTRQTIQRHR